LDFHTYAVSSREFIDLLIVPEHPMANIVGIFRRKSRSMGNKNVEMK